MGNLEAQKLLETKIGTKNPKYVEPEDGLALSHVGSAYMDIGDYETMKDLCQKALDILEANHGPDNPQTAEARANMAIAKGALGDAQGKKEELERSLRTMDWCYPPGDIR